MTLAKEYKKWPFSGINFSGGFPDLFLEVLTGINSFLRFLYEFSKKYQIPKEKYQPVLKLFIWMCARSALENRLLANI